MAAGDVPTTPASRRQGGRLWWWIVIAFVVQIAVWTGWLTFAGRHRVEEIPLATHSAGARD